MSKIKREKNESPLSCYINAWAMADFFLLEPMKQDCVAGLSKSCGEDLVVTTNLKAKTTTYKQKGILKKLAGGVATAYHAHPHAEPCQKVLVGFAFASRLFFMGMDGFIKLTEQEREFGHGFLVKLMRSRDFQYFGRLDPGSLTAFVDSRCQVCRHSYTGSLSCFHRFDAKKSLSKSSPVISWVCELCYYPRVLK